MESLNELCDLIAQNPSKFAEKLTRICERCPPPKTLLRSPRSVSQTQLNYILAVARFLSKCPDHSDETPKSLVLTFYRSIPSSFNPQFWLQCFSIDSFFGDFFEYVGKACELSSEFSSDVARFTGDVLISAIGNMNEDLGISKAALNAMCSSCPSVVPLDANNLVLGLLELLETIFPSSPVSSSNSSTTSMSNGDSTMSVSTVYSIACVITLDSTRSVRTVNSTSTVSTVDSTSSVSTVNSNMSVSTGDSITTVSAGDSTMSMSTVDSTTSVSIVDSLGGNSGSSDGRGWGNDTFEEEPVDSIEKLEMVLKLMGNVLDKVSIDANLLETVRGIVEQQLQSMVKFLKIRKLTGQSKGSH